MVDTKEKKKQRILSIILSCMMVITMIPIMPANSVYAAVVGTEFDEGDLSYKVTKEPTEGEADSGEVAVTGLAEDNNADTVTIPGTVDYQETDNSISYKITSIADGAFQGKTTLASVDLSSATNLTSIGNNAFQGCTSLGAVNIPDTVTDKGTNIFQGAEILINEVTKDTNVSEAALCDAEGNTIEVKRLGAGSTGYIKAIPNTDKYIWDIALKDANDKKVEGVTFSKVKDDIYSFTAPTLSDDELSRSYTIDVTADGKKELIQVITGKIFYLENGIDESDIIDRVNKEKAEITVTDGVKVNASVNWDWDGVDFTNYDPSSIKDQSITITGEIILTDSISNEKNVSLQYGLTVQIKGKAETLKSVTLDREQIAIADKETTLYISDTNPHTLKFDVGEFMKVYYTDDETEPTTASEEYTDGGIAIQFSNDNTEDKVIKVMQASETSSPSDVVTIRVKNSSADPQIYIDNTNKWDDFKGTLDFSTFLKDAKKVTIRSNGNEITDVKYLEQEVTDDKPAYGSVEALQTADGEGSISWTDYEGPFTLLEGKKDAEYVIYVKMSKTNEEGTEETTYISSNGIIKDTTAPTIQIKGAGDTSYGDIDSNMYSGTQTLKVTDDNLKSVVVYKGTARWDEKSKDEIKEEDLTDGSYVFNVETGVSGEDISIVATDKAENTTEKTFKILPLIQPGPGPEGPDTPPTTEDSFFNPVGGTFDKPINVSMTSKTGATIYYTTDGSVPAVKLSDDGEIVPANNSTIKYDGNPLKIETTTTIKAIETNGTTVEGNYDVKEATYTIKIVPVEIISIEFGPTRTEYVEGDRLDLSGLQIKVRMSDGSERTIGFDDLKNIIKFSIDHGTLLTTGHNGQKITVSLGDTRKELPIAIQVQAKSDDKTVATPTFSPEPGIYTAAQDVTISCTTEGATIYYTTDGSDPTIYGEVYDGKPIQISEYTKLRAIAKKDGLNSSEALFGIYRIETVDYSNSILGASGDIVKGDDGIGVLLWNKDKGEDLLIKLDGDGSNFVDLMINGKVVDPSNYELENDGTIIRLKQSYIDALEAGEYDLEILYSDGSASLKLNLSEAEELNYNVGNNNNNDINRNVLKTGDDIIALSWLSIIILASGLSIILLYKRKKYNA